MPQELHVLRCFNCKVFQVQIVKKINKWQCKMCNEKQSIKKVYRQGTGKDCRFHVQALNAQRMELLEVETELNVDQVSEEVYPVISEPHSSKWDEFLPKETQHFDEDSDFDEAYTFERTNKKIRSKNQSARSCKRSKQSSSNNEVVNQTDTEQFNNANNKDEAVVQTNMTNINSVGNSKWGDYLTEEAPLGDNSLGLNVKKTSKLDDYIQETKDIDENTITKNIFCNTDTDLDDVLNF